MVTQLTDGVYWLDLTGVNAFLLDDDELVLIDAGTRFDADDIEAGIGEAGFDLGDLDRILITHYDMDHVGALGKLPVSVPVHIGADDAPLLTGERKPPLSGLKTFTQRISGPLVPTLGNERVEVVEDGDRIGGFDAYHTPGHTPGHTVYVHEDRSACFLGDAIVERNGEFRASPWFLSHDTDRARESVRAFAGAATFDVAAMGHGTPAATDGSDRLEELAAEL